MNEAQVYLNMKITAIVDSETITRTFYQADVMN